MNTFILVLSGLVTGLVVSKPRNKALDLVMGGLGALTINALLGTFSLFLTMVGSVVVIYIARILNNLSYN
jgi:hypothetical protein